MNQDNKIIGFQGSNGSFGNIASLEFSKNIVNFKIKAFLSFQEVINALLEKQINYAVLPVKNKIIGEITDSVFAINQAKNKMNLVKIIQLPIIFYLGSKHKISIDQISDVLSQNHALSQCVKFFRAYPNLKPIEEIDTAIAAEKVAKSDKNMAAICSDLACKLNNLHILTSNFQDDTDNFTIFNIYEGL